MNNIPNDSIFLVIAERGEYSDYMTWVAAAYLSEVEAKIENDKKNGRAKYQKMMLRGWYIARTQISLKKYGCRWPSKKQLAGMSMWPCPRDPADDTDYSVLKVPIGDWGEYWPQ